MNRLLIFVFFVFIGCNKKDNSVVTPVKPFQIIACDMSFLPQIRQNNIQTKNQYGQSEDMLVTLQKAGVNTIRLRIWNNPSDGHSGLSEVKTLAGEIHQRGMKVWLTVHYSDSWADPGNQQKPLAWEDATYVQLKDSVYSFTKKLMTEINPDFIQIGNEINNGLLWPEGNSSNPEHMNELIKQGIKAVRDCQTPTKIILHYAGYKDAIPFYSKLSSADYDIIGLSYYPHWHGKSLDSLQLMLSAIGSQVNKDIVIAETAYPFTFGWNDWTNNIIGDSSQILPEFPASPLGQHDFLQSIKSIILTSPRGIGFCYWGAEWIAFQGNQATNGSSWENQALWNFNNQASYAIQVFSE